MHEPISELIIKNAERKLGVSLPLSYLEPLSEQNGGYVRRVHPDSIHSMIWGIGSGFPSITETHRSELRRWARRGMRFWQKTLPLVPFDGDGHWYLCLDYRAGPLEPCVTFIDLEIEEEHQVAETFEEFLSKLQPKISSNAPASVKATRCRSHSGLMQTPT